MVETNSQDNKIKELEHEDQQPQSSVVNSINFNPVDLVEIGRDALDIASSIDREY
ncbi:hypothetical protein [Acinetobacter higginsii]|uniref:hypothetical protein n=1 Tax=Acinetobacter higginsii TaxID=70347 RepID=UPI001F60181E|nr:hypothetical protein [Acinetobacter higginsii]